MKVSELIAALQKLKDELGDVTVITTVWEEERSHYEGMCSPQAWSLEGGEDVIKINSDGVGRI